LLNSVDHHHHSSSSSPNNVSLVRSQLLRHRLQSSYDEDVVLPLPVSPMDSFSTSSFSSPAIIKCEPSSLPQK
jgi:hypothetical protein